MEIFMKPSPLLPHLILAVLLSVSPAIILCSASAHAASQEEVQVKVVYHIDDSTRASQAMRNIQNHLNASPGVKIVVVAHGKGIDFLLNNGKDERGNLYEASVANLINQGVDFRVCNNTLKGRNLTADDVIQEASIVTSGVAEIGRLQAKEGYVYLKP
jgi:intracellular sulfur oxidation DsrE/DsrF family protein